MATPGEEEDFSEAINSAGDGWMTANGLRITRATKSEVIGELEIKPMHLQAFGLVHGGIYSAMIESLASIGAAVHVMPDGRTAVGLENHTSFLKAVRSGVLRGVARPLNTGRRSQVWEGNVSDDSGKLVATGRVRLIVLEPETDVAGVRLGLK